MAHGFYKDRVPETIEAMAADHLQSVLAIQPKGPYVVGGFCYGGVVAFEMARQLQQRGHKVAAVLMIDSQARNIPFRFARNVVSSLAAVLRLKPGTEAELFRRLKGFLLTFQEALEGGAWRTVCFAGSKMKSSAIQGARLLSRPFVRNTDDSAPDAPAAWDLRTPYWHSHLAIEAYVPGKYSGRIVLFRSTSLLEKAPGDPTAGWGHITPEIAVEWLCGDHKSCVTKHVLDLAQKMRPYLARAAGSPFEDIALPVDEVRIGQGADKFDTGA
jgi:thioesterase domain-containing protein